MAVFAQQYTALAGIRLINIGSSFDNLSEISKNF
jgi:hypothetical protein